MQRRRLVRGVVGLLGIVLVVGLLVCVFPYKMTPIIMEKAMVEDTSETTQAPVEKKLFESPLAGTWYEADTERLATEIDGYLAKVDAGPLDKVHALILPHAGYRYSGQVAAYGVKQVQGKDIRRVVVMGPSHRMRLTNMASVPGVTHYATPLGEIPLDVDFIAALKEHPQFRTVPGAHEGEHSVQIEIPLLQKVLGEFTLVPIVVGSLDLQATRTMAEILLSLIDQGTLVVASTDFTHYGPNFGYVPFREDILENLKELDMGAWEFIEKKDLDGFYGYIDRTGATICGRHPVGILLAMLPVESEGRLIKYDTSGNITGDTRSSVSYVSAAFLGQWKKGKPVEVAAPEFLPLSEEDKAQLLILARATLEHYMKNGRMPAPDEFGIEITPPMKQVMGAFVTLKKRGQLRGCIGEIFPRRALYEAVMDHAVNAGLRDHRFKPVTAAEIPELHFEISALTPPHPVDSYRDIEIGRHGMVVEKGGRSAVYLPQVAPEQGWDIEETLGHLSMKAGLSPDAWREGAAFTVFEAIVFHEAVG